MTDYDPTGPAPVFILPPWQEAFKLRDGLVQADVYVFEKVVNDLGGFKGDGASITADHALKAAIEAGWLAEPAGEVLKDKAGKSRHFLAGEKVDEMHPGKVRWYGGRIIDHYIVTTTPPPN